MKATVITTGPGVIMETATASRNWRSVNHAYSVTTPPCRNGTTARPLPKPAPDQNHNTTQGQHRENFRFGPRDHDRVHQHDGIEQGVPADARAEQLAGAAAHDRDDRCPDSVERALHPLQFAKPDIED